MLGTSPNGALRLPDAIKADLEVMRRMENASLQMVGGPLQLETPGPDRAGVVPDDTRPLNTTCSVFADIQLVGYEEINRIAVTTPPMNGGFD